MPLGLDMLSTGGFDVSAVVDHLGELASVGVTYACVSLAGESRAEFLAGVERFGAGVLGTK